jgi:hypothetical protein
VEHPYRAPSTTARWVCIACHRSLSTLSGRCPRCNVDRLDLMRPDVRDEVRQYAEKVLYQRMMREEMILGSGSILVGLFITGSLWLGILVGLAIRIALVRVYARVRPQAALAVYAARRKRHALSGIDASALQSDNVAAGDGLDPEVADMDQLLRSLGAKLD